MFLFYTILLLCFIYMLVKPTYKLNLIPLSKKNKSLLRSMLKKDNTMYISNFSLYDYQSKLHKLKDDYDSTDYIQYCLNNIRQGIITDKVKGVFKKCIGKELVNDVGIIPTELYSNNYLVDNINKTALNNLITENQMVYEYNLEFKNYGNNLDLSLQERYIKSCPVSQKLELCASLSTQLYSKGALKL